MPTGTIRRLITDRGFGFIKGEGEEDIFFHRNDLQEVEYDLHLTALGYERSKFRCALEEEKAEPAEYWLT